jgi:hypothetical protein
MKTQEMKLEEAIRFFGYPHENAEFDKYLTSIGLDERPSFEDNPIAYVEDAENGFVFIFGSKSNYEEYNGPAVDGGELIFEGVQLYSEHNDSDLAKFKGKLPFGIDFAMKLPEIIKIFGEPNLTQPSGPENIVYKWHNVQKFAIAICCLPDDKGISFVAVRPSKLRHLK